MSERPLTLEDARRALEILNAAGCDTDGAQIQVAAEVVVGDLRSARSGRDFYKRSMEDEERAHLRAAAFAEEMKKRGDGWRRAMAELNAKLDDTHTHRCFHCEKTVTAETARRQAPSNTERPR